MSEFGKHPSEKLQAVFKGFQIQKPEDAEMIFLGLDANWDKDIEKKEPLFFEETINHYLKDGVQYWKDNGVHTPMLKEDTKQKDTKRKYIYKGDRRGGGVPYHTRFSKLGFTSDYAEKICFLELLSICTFGSSTKNTKEFKKMLKSEENAEHLERIWKIFLKKNIYICISPSVREIIDELKDELNIKIEAKVEDIPHFSRHGITNDELEKLGKKLLKFLDK
ncbi:MAG: TM1812 family CRISPR-associated protein [Fibromonadaceae bacterium]|jgi:hypothetical protein|nr:TM1812 family CRISPR-associated protein [Fibromonadaceae bacterium]